MGNIGSGSGSSYPGTLDTQTAVEVDSPAGGKTKARAAVPNDLAACVLAVETALGTNPQGSKTDVKSFLQLEHNADGTHKTLSANTTGNATTATTATNMAMTGEASTTGTTLNLGTVTSGDRIDATWFCKVVQNSGNSETDLTIVQSSGTATMIFQNSQSTIGQSIKTDFSVRGTNAAYITVRGIIQVTGSGTLVIGRNIASYGTAPTISGAEGYAFFLKKQ